MVRKSVFLLVVFLLLPATAGQSQNLPWPERNGPTGDGHAAPEEARGVPLEWDEATGRNIAWRLPLIGEGHSTPVIGNGQVWFTAATRDGTQQFVYAVDAESGRVRHRKLLFENKDPEPLGNIVNTYASPTCVLEPDAVYVHFGTYGTARLDPETAETVWARRDIHCSHYRGPGSSPVLLDDLLILTFDGVDYQFLKALDTRTGQTVWRTDRTTDFRDLEPDGTPRADGDYRKAYSTPGLIQVGQAWQVVSVGARAAFGYDARTGEEIWTIEHPDYNGAIRPLFLPPLAILNTGSRGASLLGLRLDETTRGDVTDSHIVWERTRGNGSLPTPVLVEDRLYQVTDQGVLHCLDARTGEERFSARLPGNYTASPIVAHGLIYFVNERGQTTVIRATDHFQVVARSQIADGVRASPSIAGGALYLRSFQYLYKIAQTTP